MAKAKRVGAAHKAYYANYKAAKKWSSNRLKKLERALKKNPENAEQIKAAMSKVEYRRKTPTVPKWTATTRRVAQLFKTFQGKVPSVALTTPAIKSREDEEKYWKQMNEVKSGFLQKAEKLSGSMFSIAARISG